MIFENPAKKRIEKYNKSMNEEKIEELTIENNDSQIIENIVSLDSILNGAVTSEKIEIEYIENPKFVNISGVPKNIELDIGQIGKLIVKYENSGMNQKVL